MDCSNNPSFDAHEGVYTHHDPATGMHAIIAVHSTALGPAAGGCRRWHYSGVHDAVTDALRLSRGMSYKNAMAGLPFGGGKAVIMADPARPKTAEELRAFGRFVQSLEGRYVTAEDVGVSTDDMRVVGEVTRYVSGLPQFGNVAGGDPSPWTALGVFLSIVEAVRHQTGAADLKGLRVAVQGVGHVGNHLCRLLHEAGARLLLADINGQNVARAAQEFDAEVVAPEEILFAKVDVLSPCALGGILNESTILDVCAPIIAGAANNQLAAANDARRLHDRGILFLPDYVINAGGIIAVAREYLGGSTHDDVRADVENIPKRVSRLLTAAAHAEEPPSDLADRLASEIITRTARARVA